MRHAVLVAALIAVVSIAGCASVAKWATPSAQPFVQAATDIAVAAAVGTNKDTQKARAQRIKDIAQEILAVNQGGTVPLTMLEAAVNAKIASLNLPPADVAAAQILTAALEAAIQAQIGAVTGGAVTPDTQVAVNQILGFVITATSAYGV